MHICRQRYLVIPPPPVASISQTFSLNPSAIPLTRPSSMPATPGTPSVRDHIAAKRAEARQANASQRVREASKLSSTLSTPTNRNGPSAEVLEDKTVPGQIAKAAKSGQSSSGELLARPDPQASSISPHSDCIAYLSNCTRISPAFRFPLSRTKHPPSSSPPNPSGTAISLLSSSSLRRPRNPSQKSVRGCSA